MSDAPTTLDSRFVEYLQAESLRPLLGAVRQRLERNGLRVAGVVVAEVDEDAAARLGGLLGRPQQPGRVRVRLDVLDRALRESAAGMGLVAVLAELGGPLVDRPAVRGQRLQERADLWQALDNALADAGFATSGWVPAYVEGIRRSGAFSRVTAGELEQAAAVLRTIAPGTALQPAGGWSPAEPRWELAQLASSVTGDAHALDDGRPVGALVLRAIAAAASASVPASAGDRRALWEQVGVTSDRVSGTVLTWGLRPAGDEPWAEMMRERARLRLVTHLTVQELSSAESIPLAGQRVYACENPQVLQAAARADASAGVLCFAGNPSAAGLLLLSRLVDGGADVAYHGDFDWPGVAIAARLYARGASPWRMGAADYVSAVAASRGSSAPVLSGQQVATPWDPQLRTAMLRHGRAVHEEALLDLLLADVG